MKGNVIDPLIMHIEWEEIRENKTIISEMTPLKQGVKPGSDFWEMHASSLKSTCGVQG